ncbi:NINE protein [Undibacterium sp. RTI2.1]|uniref:NINE protein n=1 Tax=unclassified Undibacterium TaxID=2630295 RepID=UPI002AB4739C|nr:MULTISPECIES: NINE protein [unclassified Undibacterium]MDY7538585.1 NINE protein [Undibacterium sp. 5I1]MEB0031274.1 NINE protein [Undibacterium sp. RTI2.1]MEB0116334.1 NINE protein [Undibacterium sp. RTI2.2]MEB0232187.1 NINE protein [Undibacterium sp. 10I3]MEB0258087.1 NINE protein [Undibacterium sp. 5I1]
MKTPHKNKTLSTLLAATLGSVGAHRFYLYGKKDLWGWLHFITLPLSWLLGHFYFGTPLLITAAPIVLSFLIATLEALLIGLTPDEKWDTNHNAQSGQVSDSNWPIALILVLTLGVGAFALIATIARAFDLLYTGGSFG